jgi:hypothetical protein
MLCSLRVHRRLRRALCLRLRRTLRLDAFILGVGVSLFLRRRRLKGVK